MCFLSKITNLTKAVGRNVSFINKKKVTSSVQNRPIIAIFLIFTTTYSLPLKRKDASQDFASKVFCDMQLSSVVAVRRKRWKRRERKTYCGLDQQAEEASRPFDGLRVRGPSKEFTPNNATRGSPHYVNSGAYMCGIQFHEHYKKLAIQLTLVGLTKESVPLSTADGCIEFLAYVVPLRDLRA